MNFAQAIESIRELSRQDITAIISDYITLKTSGHSMKGCCPFHDEKTPSFFVSDQRGTYKCFGCGIGGDAIDFVMRIDGKEFHEVIYQFANRFHITIDKTQSGHGDKSAHKQSPIPGLKEVRSEIRKSGSVSVVCDGTPAGSVSSKAIVHISAPLRREQAKALRKYTDHCELIIENTDWEKSQDCIKAALDAGFTVTVPADGKSMDWIHYVVEFIRPDHSDIIKLLASIPDTLTRSVYVAEYSHLKTTDKGNPSCM